VNTVEIPALSGSGVLAFVLLLATAAVTLVTRRQGRGWRCRRESRATPG
jgi:hypothetical protein